jgi:hypothetical protein
MLKFEDTPYYSIVFDYSATGEGHTILVLCDYFENEQKALEAFKVKFVTARRDDPSGFTEKQKDKWEEDVWRWMKIVLTVKKGLNLDTLILKLSEKNYPLGNRCLPSIILDYHMNCS